PRHDQAAGESRHQKGGRLVALRAAGARPAGADRGRAGGRPATGRGAGSRRPILAAAQLVPGVTREVSMSHTALRREFSDLIDLDAPVDRLAGGFTFTEGPIWHPRDQYLLFSDIPADVRRRYDDPGRVRGAMPAS